MVAHTVVLTAETVTGSAADVITAAHQAAEVALRLLRPGNTNSSVTDAIERVANAYNVVPVQGVQSTMIQPFNLEGAKVIALKHDPEVKVETSTIELNEVYAVDIAMSTGDGRPRNTELRTTVYRRNLDISYPLRMKAARWLVSEANKMAPVLPFSIRSLNDEVQVKLGIVEAAKQGVLLAYPLLQEKPGVITSHFKFTALVLKNGTFKATGFDLPASVKSDKSRKFRFIAYFPMFCSRTTLDLRPSVRFILIACLLSSQCSPRGPRYPAQCSFLCQEDQGFRLKLIAITFDVYLKIFTIQIAPYHSSRTCLPRNGCVELIFLI